jgi:hypothetical protein
MPARIAIPINAPLSIGMDHSRTDYFRLKNARVGIVSVYERALNLVELTALYEDYNSFYQNIQLISDALLTCDLTKPENVEITENVYISDTSGNDNSLQNIDITKNY